VGVVDAGVSIFFGAGAGRACSAASFSTKAAEANMGITTSSSPKRRRILFFRARACSGGQMQAVGRGSCAALCGVYAEAV